MEPTTKTYNVTVTWQGQTKTFSFNLSHDGSLSQDEINQTIINDFYSTISLEIEEKELSSCCPICSSHTFDGCPECENYL